MERKRDRVLEGAAILAAVVVFGAAVGVLHFVFRDPEEPARQEFLDALASKRSALPSSLTFHSEEREIILRNPEDVGEFVSLLVAPNDVHAHHSHPAASLRFELAGDPQAWVLCRDSDVENEFWLQVPAGSIDFTLKRLRSTELEAWLARHRVSFSTAAWPNGGSRK